ncbi:hypothetical protein QJQ45_015815 [Haematococcus lacustris]|nr:hypothetical protein QJQ45_015815 [Haematococcus lacustris]
MAAPSPDDPNALGSDGLPKFAHTTQTFGGKKSTVAQVYNQLKGCTVRANYIIRVSLIEKLVVIACWSSSQEQQVGGAWSVSLDFRCRQLEHDRCNMAWWLQARQQRRRATANKEVARSQQGMTRSKTA